MTSVVVECYAGCRYPERPRAFVWEGERVMVEEIERQWRTPDGLAFYIRAAGERFFTLAYDETTDDWEIQPQFSV